MILQFDLDKGKKVRRGETMHTVGLFSVQERNRWNGTLFLNTPERTPTKRPLSFLKFCIVVPRQQNWARCVGLPLISVPDESFDSIAQPPSPAPVSSGYCYKITPLPNRGNLMSHRLEWPAFECLKGKRVVLASSSPRRVEMFHNMGLNFEVIPSAFAEDLDKSSFPDAIAYCQETCRRKGEMVLQSLLDSDPQSPRPTVVVSADTIVVSPYGEICEKPDGKDDAVRMLTSMSGGTTLVVTAVTMFLARPDGSYTEVSFKDTTEMFMGQYDGRAIEAYLATGQGMGNSGALAYQGAAFLMVNGINGCFYNLVGFPAPKFQIEFSKVSHLLSQ